VAEKPAASTGYRTMKLSNYFFRTDSTVLISNYHMQPAGSLFYA